MKMEIKKTLYLTPEERKVLQHFAFWVLGFDGDTTENINSGDLLRTIADGYDEDTMNNINIVITKEEN